MGAGTGFVGNVVEEALTRRASVRQQDEAVGQVIQGGIAEETDQALPGSVPD